jgi:hypothetical protein
MSSSYFSKTLRQAKVMRKHVQKLADHQRDILPPQDLAAITTALDGLQKAITERADKEVLEKEMENLAQTAEKRLKPYPNASYRENVEVLLVALAVAMGIRTFFVQPFKIPTGSMQPTLFGVNSTPDHSHPPSDETVEDSATFEVPKGWPRIREWFGGVSYVDIKAKTEGELENVDPTIEFLNFKMHQPVKFLIFSILETLQIGGKTHWIWFPPDYGGSTLAGRAGLRPHQYFKKGEQVVKMRIVTETIYSLTGSLTISARPSVARSSFSKRKEFQRITGSAGVFHPTSFISSAS